MPTQITQIENASGTVLRVEGDMLYDDAIVLEKIAGQLLDDPNGTITIDLSELDFLDSDSAPVLRRMQQEPRLLIEGIEIFLQSAIDAVERTR